MKSWITTKKRIFTSKQQLIFLLRCRKYDILPAHIKNLKTSVFFHSNSVNQKYYNIVRRNAFRLLNLEIKDINFNLNFLQSNIHNIEKRLSDYLPPELLTRFFEFNKQKLLTFNRIKKNDSIKKFYSLMRSNNLSLNPFKEIDRSKWLVNLSNKKIPDNVLDILSLGDKFSIPVNQNDRKDRINSVVEVAKNLEINCCKIPNELVDSTRSAVVKALRGFLCKNKHVNHIDRHITSSFNVCQKFLKNNKDILVTKADKGQATVIMDMKNYTDKMNLLLQDQSTYSKLKKDPIKKLTTKMSTLVKSWRDNDLIDVSTYKLLNTTNGNLPRCYGLPKIHKTNAPLRIIVSSLGSPVYNIARFIHEILERSIRKPSSHIKDGWTFANIIKNHTIKDNEVLVSLDVTSLFTNIPKDLALKAIEKRWTEISDKTTFSLPQFLYAVETVLESTSFCFNGQYYEQIYGTPMGSPLSPILADLVMDELETHCLNLLQFDISVYYRYVDDIFTIVPRTEIDTILSTFNSFHQRLQFTHEIENNNVINFLDTTVIRCGGKLLTNWYLKPTSSGRYLNYHSNHPFNYKINTINNLVDHAIMLSDDRFHSENIRTVKKILSNNCFPPKIIDRYVQKRVCTLRERKNMTISVDNNSRAFDISSCILLPYIKNLSDNISRTIKKTSLKLIYTIPKKLDKLIKRGKDKLSKTDRTNIVYKIDCNKCDATYIGQTKRHLNTRIKEHINNIKVHTSNHNVISKHKTEYMHDFNWTSPNILHCEKHTRKREIAEMFFIKKHNNTINLQKDTDNLNPIYDNIIKVV